MNSCFTLSLEKGIALISESERIILESQILKLTFSCPQTGLQTAFNHLKHSPQTHAQLQQLVREKDGNEAAEKLETHLQKLIYLGWICHSLLPLATAIPMTGDYQFHCPKIDWQQQSFTLSRFAYLHQNAEETR